MRRLPTCVCPLASPARCASQAHGKDADLPTLPPSSLLAGGRHSAGPLPVWKGWTGGVLTHVTPAAAAQVTNWQALIRDCHHEEMTPVPRLEMARSPYFLCHSPTSQHKLPTRNF